MGMAASNITFGGVILLALAAAVWLAIELLPRRRGSTPHCRRCRYNLTGLNADDSAARCPECGALLSRAGALVKGERRYRPARLVGAAVLVALLAPIACALVYARTTNLDWRRVAPTWVLLRMAGGTLEADAALVELARRWEADLLSTVQIADFANACLIHHGAPDPKSHAPSIATDTLGDLLLAAALSPAQEQRFIDQTLSLQTSVREPLVTGMNACVRIAYARRLPSQLEMTVQLRNRTLNGLPCAMAPGPSSWATSGCGADGQFEQVLLMPAAGAHEFAVDAEALVTEKARPAWQAASAPGSPAPILLRTRKTATARIIVVQDDPANFVRPINTPAAYQAAAAVHVAGILYRPTVSAIEVCVVLLEPSALWMIFDARLILEDRDIDLGRVSLVPNDDSRLWTLRASVDDPLPDVVAMELRANPALARQEALAAEFFGGSLQFETVPVVRERADGSFFLPLIGLVPAPRDDADCPE